MHRTFPHKYAEWNFWVDPYAVKGVFSAGLLMCLTPLDATNKLVWTSDEADKWEAFGTAEGKLAAEILRWYLSYLAEMYPEGVYLSDLIAAINTTNPDLCQAERVYVQVLTESGGEEGRTVVLTNQPPNVTTFLTPRVEEVKTHAARIYAMR